jgi:hypothetical protein
MLKGRSELDRGNPTTSDPPEPEKLRNRRTGRIALLDSACRQKLFFKLPPNSEIDRTPTVVRIFHGTPREWIRESRLEYLVLYCFQTQRIPLLKSKKMW